jgi:CubicO group peptidase (beta-lactamase class C family)
VLEEYFALSGKISGPYINEAHRMKLHQLSSVTKGILSLVSGIALEQGYISGVDQPIHNYLPQYARHITGDNRQIQIKHLLTMTSGWRWNQFNYSWSDERNDAANMYKCEDVVEYVLERPVSAKPGEKFNYTNGEPTVLGVVLGNACGMEVDEFTDLHLFDPLGIADYIWTRYPDGSLETDGGLKLRSRDLLKIGILVLSSGEWNGKQIVNRGWISESTRPGVSLSMHRGYGYYWNTMKYGSGSGSGYAIFVPGSGGQFMAIFPSLDMVIVFTAGIYDKDPAKMYWAVIRDNILPALKSE